mgnify:CR=1 FL=1
MTSSARSPLSGWVILLRVVVVLAVVLLLNRLASPYLMSLEYMRSPASAAALQRGLVLTCILYALLLALPFVPGVEIGIGLLTLFGASVAPHVYLATVAGLSLAYLVGRLIPLRLLARASLRLRMRRTTALIVRLEPLSHAERIATLTERAPPGWIPLLLRYLLLALAVLLNTPGNALIGGGGGIALVIGISRLISPGAFLVVVMLAVAPVPILVSFFGADAIFTAPD